MISNDGSKKGEIIMYSFSYFYIHVVKRFETKAGAWGLEGGDY